MFMTAAPVLAADHTLNPGDSIQENITAAGAGDTIILNPGTYYQHDIFISRNIIIRANTSAGGSAANTVIDGQKAGRIFAVSDGYSLAIESLTLDNGSADFGGAIRSNGSTITVTSSVFTNFSASRGGAIAALKGSDLTVISSSFSRCSASDGGAISMDGVITGTSYMQAGSLAVVSSTFSDCTATNGGTISTLFITTVNVSSSTFTRCTTAISCIKSNSLTITSSSFAGCRGDLAGAVFNDNGTVTITSSSFSGCSGGSGGAVFIGSGITARITSTTFSGCTAANQGGAIYLVTSSSLTIDDSSFSDCSAPAGGAILVLGTSELSVSGSGFTNCSATGATGTGMPAFMNSGGAILMNHQSRLIVESSTFAGCSATGEGGAIMNYGQGISTIHNSRFYHNTAGTAGPAIRADSAADASDNWWGSNDNPAAQVSGPVTTDPWLVLGITADPSAITTAGASAIRANLTFNSAGTDTAANGVFVPAGIATLFTVTGGSGSVSPLTAGMADGIAQTTFSPTGTGTSTVTAFVDNQPVSIIISVSPAPTPTPAPGPEATLSYYLPDTSGGDDKPPAIVPVKTVTVNIGGESAAGQATVTGTLLSDLIVTGTVRFNAGTNLTAPPGIVYQYLSLVPARYSTITGAVINFTVPQSWLEKHNIASESIVLYHQTADGWEALPTTVLYTKDGTVYFSAESTGFSQFAIAGTPTVATPFTTEPIPASLSTPVKEQTPAAAPIAQKPIVTDTTAAPAPAEAPGDSSGIPVLLALIGIGCAGLAGGSWYIRRWWIQRQNPALFAEYD